MSPFLFGADTIATSIAEGLLRAWRGGGNLPRILVALTAFSATVALTLFVVAVPIGFDIPLLKVAAGVSGVIAGILSIGFLGYQRIVEETARDEVIQQAQERVREHPDEPKAAWELARIKLESYLQRNLSQIRWIFGITLVVMLAGFGIIGYGIVRIYDAPTNFLPSIVVTTSGIIVELIAATFLVIYRSTMEQARDYVNILERINAVGMSVQIIENIDDSQVDLRDKTRADVALSLLSLYGMLKAKP
ncbi:MAG TPA: hypothetical protein VF615_30605 [Longimicrobiaceae bacterium]|jgi:hypothetical protein